MNVGFFGSGAFGLPTLEALLGEHDVSFVVSQPDRPAGRRRERRATPIAEAATERDLHLLRPERLDDATVATIRDLPADAWVVIAYGLKLPPTLLQDRFACNLHGSLLPRWRGAAPIQRCLMAGDDETGVSVITLASVMDAGELLATRRTAVDPLETAGELHDRLSLLGPAPVLETLSALEAGTLAPESQDEAAVTQASKLSRADATVDFSLPSGLVQGRTHGLTPWPGCDVMLGSDQLRLRRVRACPDEPTEAEPGTILASGRVACGSGQLEILEVQSPGGRPMTWDQWQLGHPVEPGARFNST
ncbi:MAG: hypothetical protein MK116_11745 [Phycisphaerales bacterium]|nr:hypothetical protein [Phycisphaerales bacterium]